MKKKVKILIIILALIILSGCSSKVTIKLDKNNHVKETVNIRESSNQDYSLEDAIDGSIKYYNLDTNKYSTEKIINEDNFGVDITHESDDLCYELKGSYFSAFFSDVKCDDDDSNYIIDAKSSYTYCNENESGCSPLNDIAITFELPEKARKTNADLVNGNKYTWKFDRESKDKRIYMKIKKYETRDKKVSKKTKEQNKYAFLFIILFILVIAVIVVSLYEKYKKNKVEY